MDLDSTKKFCSFCGDPGRHETPLFGGLGAFICGPCVQHFHETVLGERLPKAPPWEAMSDAEVLGQLWAIAQTGFQAEDFLAEWVALARSRGGSWTAVAQALGIPRQDALDRFS
ncbi:ClpX C4-type zinc finger protein [Nocardioides sp. URHA0020]|uniref:ClpX C4-type zinc finger protein n=1 Tax=Nocardioides sp. URHA0020 TaxID=1380392 RepID=UPI000687DA4E|nr:ClpX C4-type zinc finger protein [Nocardioides sp. URHA0020]